jgi:hypothetical protein
LTLDFLRNLGQRNLQSKDPDLGKDVSGAELDAFLYELLEMGWHLGDKLSPRLTIICRSSEKVSY